MDRGFDLVSRLNLLCFSRIPVVLNPESLVGTALGAEGRQEVPGVKFVGSLVLDVDGSGVEGRSSIEDAARSVLVPGPVAFPSRQGVIDVFGSEGEWRYFLEKSKHVGLGTFDRPINVSALYVEMGLIVHLFVGGVSEKFVPVLLVDNLP